LFELHSSIQSYKENHKITWIHAQFLIISSSNASPHTD